jgi:hypothetical protein
MSNICPSSDGSRKNFRQRAMNIQQAENMATRLHILIRDAVSFLSMHAASLDNFTLEVSEVGRQLFNGEGDGELLLLLTFCDDVLLR